jgi:hypothetical protein
MPDTQEREAAALQHLIDDWRASAAVSESEGWQTEASAFRTCAADLERHIRRAALAAAPAEQAYVPMTPEEMGAIAKAAGCSDADDGALVCRLIGAVEAEVLRRINAGITGPRSGSSALRGSASCTHKNA